MKLRIRVSLFFILATLGIVAGVSTSADTLIYGVNEEADVVEINLSLGTASPRPGTSVGTKAFANDPATGRMFYFEFGPSSDEFNYWDPGAGTSTLVRQFTPSPGRLASRMTVSDDGTLYVMDDGDDLMILDQNNGAVTFVGNVGGLVAGTEQATGDIAFAGDGTLYLVTQQHMYSVDINTTTATLLHSDMLAGGTTAIWTGLASCEGVLYASHEDLNTGDSSLFSIDPVSGVVVELFSLGQTVDDITSCPANLADQNNPPLADDQSVVVAEDIAIAITLTGNDPDLDSLTFTLVSNPANGTLTGVAPNLTYQGDFNYSGPDAFTFEVEDGNLTSAFATITVDVQATNDAPTAINDSYNVIGSETLNITAPGILGNDNDPEGAPLTAILVVGTSDGILNLNADGSFSYTPDSGFSGNDSFTYQANDGALNSNIATVTISVTGFNNPPTATNDSYTVAEDTTLNEADPGVLGNDNDLDGDPLEAFLVDSPANGAVTLFTDGSFDYTPDPDFNGSDSFTYENSDGLETSNTATVSVDVTPSNDAPIALADTYSVDSNDTLNVAAPGVLTNDSDIDGDALTANLISSPQNGTLNLNSDGSFDYTPDFDFEGHDAFTYEADDGQSTSVDAEVSIIVGDPTDTIIYGANRDGQLTELNLSQNTYQTVGTLPFGTQAMEQDFETGLIYYTEFLRNWDELGTWDPVTGINNIAFTYNPPLGRFAKRLAISPAGVLYLMDSGDRLYTIDKVSGTITLLGNVNGLERGRLGGTGDMAFAPDGTLYVATYKSLYIVDVVTRQPTLLYSDMLQDPPGSEVVWTGLAVCNGLLYGSHVNTTFGNSAIYEIDPATGSVNEVISTTTYFNDLTSCAPIP